MQGVLRPMHSSNSVPTYMILDCNTRIYPVGIDIWNEKLSSWRDILREAMCCPDESPSFKRGKEVLQTLYGEVGEEMS